MLRFQCKTFGKNFKPSGSFYSSVSTTCQNSKLWSVTTIADPCECESVPVWPVCHVVLQGLTVLTLLLLQPPASLSSPGSLPTRPPTRRPSCTSVMLATLTTDSRTISTDGITLSPVAPTTRSRRPPGPSVWT